MAENLDVRTNLLKCDYSYFLLILYPATQKVTYRIGKHNRNQTLLDFPTDMRSRVAWTGCIMCETDVLGAEKEKGPTNNKSQQLEIIACGDMPTTLLEQRLTVYVLNDARSRQCSCRCCNSNRSTCASVTTQPASATAAPRESQTV